MKLHLFLPQVNGDYKCHPVLGKPTLRLIMKPNVVSQKLPLIEIMSLKYETSLLIPKRAVRLQLSQAVQLQNSQTK